MKRLVRAVALLVALYLASAGALALVMLQPPARFGRVMKHLPLPIVWGILPGPRIWLWARKGSLVQGQLAPDFDLALHDRSGRVTLSSYRGKCPVVLVFGSYT